MPTLHVRNVPTSLHGELKRRAESDRRSLGDEVIVLLERAIATTGPDPERVDAALGRLDRRRRRMKMPDDWPGSLAMLREDRGR